nr:GH184 muramidase [Chaetomium sp. ZY369]
MQLSLTALALAAALPMVSAYPVKADLLNCRTGPGTSYDLVTQYKKGTDVKITCQTTGTVVEGHNLWDKTSDGCYVADFYIQTGTSGYVADKCGETGGGGDTGGNLPGLTAVQSRNARAIIGEAKKEGLGRQGCEAGIATAIVESNILIYANKKVKESYNYPHDAVGEDHDSVGIFQQRVTFYPDIEASMDPARSAAQFFTEMKRISGWKTMDVGTLCQKVQRSAYPDRYGKQVDKAGKICAAGGM